MPNRSDQDIDEWGVDDGDSPPPPPAPPMRSGMDGPPSDPPASVLELGPPPADPGESQTWAYNVMQRLAWEAATDTGISAQARRKETARALMAAARFYPDAAREGAAKLIREHQRKINEKRVSRASATTEPAPLANVIPLRG